MYAKSISNNIEKFEPKDSSAKEIKEKIGKQLKAVKDLTAKIQKKYIFKTIKN